MVLGVRNYIYTNFWFIYNIMFNTLYHNYICVIQLMNFFACSIKLWFSLSISLTFVCNRSAHHDWLNSSLLHWFCLIFILLEHVTVTIQIFLSESNNLLSVWYAAPVCIIICSLSTYNRCLKLFGVHLDQFFTRTCSKLNQLHMKLHSYKTLFMCNNVF